MKKGIQCQPLDSTHIFKHILAQPHTRSHTHTNVHTWKKHVASGYDHTGEWRTTHQKEIFLSCFPWFVLLWHRATPTNNNGYFFFDTRWASLIQVYKSQDAQKRETFWESHDVPSGKSHTWPHKIGHTQMQVKMWNRSWRDGPVGKRPGCACKKHEFGSQEGPCA